MPDNLTITRDNMTFDTGHRLLSHEMRCANLHGHTYKLAIECYTPDELDSVGRVVDFSVIKGVIGAWVDKHLDHTTILHREDPLAAALPKIYEDTLAYLKRKGIHRRVDFYRDSYLVDFEPTCENLAKHIGPKAQELLDSWHKEQEQNTPRVLIKKLTLWETSNCRATWTAKR